MAGDLVDRWKLLGAIAADSSLPPSAPTVAFWMIEYEGSRGMFLGKDALATLTSLSERTIWRAQRALVDGGYFKVTHQGGGRNRPSVFAPLYSKGDHYHAERRGKLRDTQTTLSGFLDGDAATDNRDALAGDRDSVTFKRDGHDCHAVTAQNPDSPVHKPCQPCPETLTALSGDSTWKNPPVGNPPESTTARATRGVTVDSRSDHRLAGNHHHSTERHEP